MAGYRLCTKAWSRVFRGGGLDAIVVPISTPKSKGINCWKGDDEARRASPKKRSRLLSEVVRQALELRAELVEHSFALAMD